ncbi:hypothetical protein BH11BAC3_BH11BAC3_34440 [soil metagenome]
MTLTERASKYLNTLQRNSEFYLDRETTIEYCNKKKLIVSENLLDIQVHFSGYKLTIKNDIGNGFLLKLFSKADVKNNREIEVYHFDKTYVVDFGEHDTAQFRFFITNSGELCTLGHQDKDTPNIICSSIEKFVEQYALQDELALQTKNLYYHTITNAEELIKLLERDFTKIEECSDKYSQWFTNGQLTVDKGTWLDRPEFYLHIYGRKKENCDKFVENLRHYKIIA